MTSDRIKEIQQQTAYPDSLSVKHALLQVWNECQQEYNKAEKEKLNKSDVIGSVAFAKWVVQEGWGYKLDGLREKWGRAKKEWKGKGDYWEWKTDIQLYEMYKATDR